eukprot:TRINITY_DN3971_c0_g1_i1.p2 TRINITY_DN3971_c0_g1~~TRINITY_DN3971_c0_g1_i1.p2  ORF type:complete len:105 (+),score=7.14 TRINITY_DN3971_c0_g1_i1:358-672(+)
MMSSIKTCANTLIPERVIAQFEAAAAAKDEEVEKVRTSSPMTPVLLRRTRTDEACHTMMSFVTNYVCTHIAKRVIAQFEAAECGHGGGGGKYTHVRPVGPVLSP